MPGKCKQWNIRIEDLAGFEGRRITRVLLEERPAETTFGYFQMALL
jgi:hypothetical protein